MINGIPVKQIKEYSLYRNMLRRCFTRTSHNFKYYGGRGIGVCSRWLESFENFYEDMGNRPNGCSLDRLDNDGHYAPENCKWSSHREQASNKRNNNKTVGVGWVERDKRWRAYVHVDGKQKSLGYFITEQEAIDARKMWEIPDVS